MEDPVGSTQTHQLRVFDPRSGPSANRVNVRVIFAASCQPENPCANKVPHRSSNRFYQWPFGKWRIHSDPSQRGSNEGPAFCALKYRLIAPGFWWRFCKISCVYLSLPTNVIGPPNIFEISNFAIRIRWFFFFFFFLSTFSSHRLISTTLSRNIFFASLLLFIRLSLSIKSYV